MRRWALGAKHRSGIVYLFTELEALSIDTHNFDCFISISKVSTFYFTSNMRNSLILDIHNSSVNWLNAKFPVLKVSNF